MCVDFGYVLVDLVKRSVLVLVGETLLDRNDRYYYHYYNCYCYYYYHYYYF